MFEYFWIYYINSICIYTYIFKSDKRTSYLLSVKNPTPTPIQTPRPSLTAPTAENPYKPLSGLQNATVIGIVQANFLIYNITSSSISYLNELSYNALLSAAKLEFSGIIDIVDITWVRDTYPNNYRYNISGKVVRLEYK